MENFAFIIHPIDARRDVARAYPVARYLPERWIESLIRRQAPMPVARVTGLRASNGSEAEGTFIALPLTPRQFLSLPLHFIYDRLAQCADLAESCGARIIGLGAFTSVVGDGGITVANRCNIAVTTGNSYTVATAVEGAVRAAELMGISLPDAVVSVVGATGSIGATCATILSRYARGLALVGRDSGRLERAAAAIPTPACPIRTYTNVGDGLHDADIVITVSSAAGAIVLPKHIKPGAVVCDVARPRDVSVAVSRERDDVLVIEGGLVRPPGDMRCTKVDSDAPFSFGFPPGTAYACMSETMALALAGRYESFTLGKTVSVAQAREIAILCRDLGFRLDGFRSFERAVSDDEIAHVRARCGHKPLGSESILDHLWDDVPSGTADAGASKANT